MKYLDTVVLAFLIFAGINWGVWGLFEFNMVYYVFKPEWVNRFIYVLLGGCGIYLLIGWKNIKLRIRKK